MVSKVEQELLELQKLVAELSDPCEVPGCIRPVVLKFYNRRVCQKHWVQDGVEINLKEIFNIVDKQVKEEPKVAETEVIEESSVSLL